MDSFSSLSLPINLAIFAGGAFFVWMAGARLAGYADEISRRSGLGEALMGLLLLAGVTSLPEIATSVTAASVGNAPLAVNNLLGSIAMQVAVLAIGDLIYGKRALTSVVPDPTVILQGSLNVCLLCAVAIAAIVGDHALGGAGWWTWGLAIGAFYSMHKLVEANDREPWIANAAKDELPGPGDDHPMHVSHLGLGLRTALAAIVILLAGSLVALTGDAIAQQSGLGSSFMGYAFVAIATSLPEASTVFASMKRGLYTMAISDILGTNIINVALLFLVDLVAPEKAVMASVGEFAAVAAILGAAVTGLFMMGLAERRDRAFLRMGVDSIAVLATYFSGLVLLFTLRGDA
jgi:cation:H+ antiporter